MQRELLAQQHVFLCAMALCISWGEPKAFPWETAPSSGQYMLWYSRDTSHSAPWIQMADPAHHQPALRDTGENGGREGSCPWILKQAPLVCLCSTVKLKYQYPSLFLLLLSCSVAFACGLVLSRATGKGSLVGADTTESKITNCVGLRRGQQGLLGPQKEVLTV